jgi:site-specific DNA recombinase
MVTHQTTSRLAAQYARRSSESEDRQVLSINGQKEANLQAIERNGDTLVTTYEESGSAKTPGTRPELRRMIGDIRAGKVRVIYVWKMNRLARNPVEGGEIQWLLQQGILEAIVTPEKTYLPTDNVLQMAIELGMATQFSIDLAKDVKRGMGQKVRMGWKPGVAPVGYLPDYGGIKGQRRIFKDPERFDLVRQCWEMLLLGMTVPKILDAAKQDLRLTIRGARGKASKPMQRSALYNVFNNPFYYGEFEWKGEIAQGAHDPMITRAEFDRAQEVLGRRGRPRPQKHETPYAGLIQCGECGCMIILDEKKKFVKGINASRTYRYYRCSRRRLGVTCHQRVALKEEELEVQLADFAARVELPQELIDWSIESLQRTQRDRMRSSKDRLKGLHASKEDTAAMIDALVDRQLRPATSLPEDVFQGKLKELEAQKKRTATLVADFDAESEEWTKDIIVALRVTANLRQTFLTATREQKFRLLATLGSRLELRDGTVTMGFAEPFATFLRGKQGLPALLPPSEPLTVALQSAKSAVSEFWCTVLDDVRTIMLRAHIEGGVVRRRRREVQTVKDAQGVHEVGYVNGMS